MIIWRKISWYFQAIDFFKNVIICLGILPVFMSVHPVGAVPTEARRGRQIPWSCSSWQLWATEKSVGTTVPPESSPWSSLQNHFSSPWNLFVNNLPYCFVSLSLPWAGRALTVKSCYCYCVSPWSSRDFCLMLLELRFFVDLNYPFPLCSYVIFFTWIYHVCF